MFKKIVYQNMPKICSEDSATIIQRHGTSYNNTFDCDRTLTKKVPNRKWTASAAFCTKFSLYTTEICIGLGANSSRQCSWSCIKEPTFEGEDFRFRKTLLKEHFLTETFRPIKPPFGLDPIQRVRTSNSTNWATGQ